MSIRKLPLSTGALLAALLGGIAARSAVAHMIPRTGSQMVRESAAIVVAIVQGRDVHWNPQHNLIVTDYTLEIEDRLKGDAPAEITVTIPGGTLDGETHSTCLTVELETGSRYLLFLGELGKPTFSPITGAWQGLFREIPDKDGRSLIAAGPSREILTRGGSPVSFQDFVAAVRALAVRVQALPAAEGKRGSGVPRQALYAKTYDPAASLVDLQPAMPLTDPTLNAPPLPLGAQAESIESGDRTQLGEKFFYTDRASAPVTFNQLPATEPYSPYDQYQMAYWNIYGRNLFRTSQTPTGTWAFRNGVFDIAGFPGDADLIDIFGNGWPAGTLGVTLRRAFGGQLLEADIALNPAIPWTLDVRESTRGDGPFWLFQHTMLHELGHAWGLEHPWGAQDVWWDSALNYAPKTYRLAELYADDTAAVRQAYPGMKLRDVLISSYVTIDTPDSPHATYVPALPSVTTVHPGSSFLLTTPIKIENVGTVKIVKPTVEVYLVPERFSLSGAIRLKTVVFRTTLLPGNRQLLALGTLTVPRNARGGTYYLAFVARDRADRVQSNNAAWSNWDVTVSVE